MEEQKLQFVPPDVEVPEITLKGFLLSIVLTLIMSASTIYLGLKVGLTVSASIPAAVLSMGLLGLFKRSNILENNIVQTAASGGMSLASGVIFCLPALVIMGVWDEFHYLESLAMTLYGGILGVMFSIPFRKTLLNEPTLHYPEGTAITHVLQAKASQSQSLYHLLIGGAVGAFVSFCQTGLKVLNETISLWFKFGSTVGGFGVGLSPVLLGAGFIIGARVAIVALVGVIIGWVIGIPILGAEYTPFATGKASNVVMNLWSEHVRYIGVGILLLGGVWTFILLIIPLIKGLKIATRSNIETSEVLRTDKEMSLTLVVIICLILAIPIFFAYQSVIDVQDFRLVPLQGVTMNIALVCYTLVAGLIFSVVCGYMVGMVGSSASPLSALALGAIIIVCMIILGFMGGYGFFQENPDKAIAAATLAITVGVVIICAAAITNDTIQDLKVGHMVGATPLKQQMMQIFGVIIAAFIIPPILELLFQAYGLANVLPRPGMDVSKALAAPQAQLMASIASGVFEQDIPWNMIGIGFMIAGVTIAFDFMAREKGYGSIPVIALGLGVYLPITASTPLILGGIMAGLAQRKLEKNISERDDQKAILDSQKQKVFIIASGLIAGGALVGIFLAVPFVIYKSTDALAIVSADFALWGQILGAITTAMIIAWVMKAMLKVDKD